MQGEDADQFIDRQSLLEEWKTLAASDASDDIWAAQKENMLLPVGLACLGFATNFLLSGKDALLVLFAGAAGRLLLVCNFVAIEGINNHQAARRMRMREIEQHLPLEFYTRQEELRVAVIDEMKKRAVQTRAFLPYLFLRSSALAMTVRLRRLRFSIAIAGGLYSLLLVIMVCTRT